MSFDVVSPVSAAHYMTPVGLVTSSMLLRVIDLDLDDEFNAHELCAAVSRRYPMEYREEVLQKASSADPAKAAASSLSARLNFAPFDTAVRHVGFEMSQRSRVALFRKK